MKPYLFSNYYVLGMMLVAYLVLTLVLQDIGFHFKGKTKRDCVTHQGQIVMTAGV